MNQDRDAYQAQREAPWDVNAHPERPLSHDTTIRTYLTGMLYAESYSTEYDEPPRPVDEPAPLARPGHRH